MTTPLTSPFRQYVAVSPRYKRRSGVALVVAAVGMPLVAPAAEAAGWTVVAVVAFVVGWVALLVATVIICQWRAVYRAAEVKAAAAARVERTDPPDA